VEAEDAAQDAFLIAYRRLGSFRGDGPLGGWLMRIAIREATARARRRRALVRLDDGASPVLEIAVARSTVRSTEPSDVAEARERVASLSTAIHDLPAHYRDAVTMRYVEGLTFDEIAERTGRPAPTVRTHVHRALHRLRERVAPEVRP
jgi:RNA polymerase sigma-70 factor (ECF subfamily)